jgi:hypothetical protein
LWEGRQIHIGPPYCAQRLENSARHPRQIRDSPDILKPTASQRSLYRGIKHVRRYRRYKSASEARGQQRKRENIPADRTFARGGKALTPQGQWAVNNQSRSHALSST